MLSLKLKSLPPPKVRHFPSATVVMGSIALAFLLMLLANLGVST